MEEYKEIKNDAPNILDVPDAFIVITITPQGENYKELSQSKQIMPQIGSRIRNKWDEKSGYPQGYK